MVGECSKTSAWGRKWRKTSFKAAFDLGFTVFFKAPGACRIARGPSAGAFLPGVAPFNLSADKAGIAFWKITVYLACLLMRMR
jgi:hypothetical protein